jgi:hypothetical protein
LDRLSVRIDALYEKIENNTKLSGENKAILLSQLIALQDLITEELEFNIEEEELDIDELLDIEDEDEDEESEDEDDESEDEDDD